MKKAFKITANNQYVQQVALPADIYTYQCNVLNPSDTYTFGLLTESGVWNYYEVEVTKDVWAHRAKLEFKTEEAVTAFSLCSANASVANPVYVQNPILAERAEFSGIATKSLEEYVSELESGLVTENCTATLANGVLTISDATADKGKVTLSIIEESSVISTQVFFEKGLTPSQSAKLEAISKGMTVIDGGYIYSNLMELGDVDGNRTAGISGLDKDVTGVLPDGYMPANWSGGTFQQAVNFAIVYKAMEDKTLDDTVVIPDLIMANNVELHIGISKNGDLIIDQHGNITTFSGEFEVVNGKVNATDGSFKGKVSVPFVIIDSFTSGSIINLDNSFNISTHSYMADKTIYLPIDEKYNGVTCYLYNGGRTQNEGSFKVRVEGEQGFIGGGASYDNQIGNEIYIHKGQIGQFICVKTLGGSIGWACTNYADLQL